jgi:thermitase
MGARGISKVAVVAALAVLACAPAASAAPARYDAHTLIVKYRDRAPAAQRTLAARTAGVLETLGRVTGLGAQVVHVSGDPAAIAARLNRSDAVAYAEPNFIYRATATPDDPLYGQLYGLNEIEAPRGWDLAGLGAFPGTGAGAKIGIVDTGIDAAHEDLAGKVVACAGVRSFGINVLNILRLLDDPAIVNGRCADDNGHGTHVAGTAAARANNGRGIAGVSFDSPLAICKALDSSGAGTLAAIANCITYLNGQGAKIISMSLSGASSQTLANAVAAASNNGSLLIAAAGNDGAATPSYPAAYPQVVSVAAVDRNDAHAPFSTANADVELSAPGVDILSAWPGGSYRTLSGTSMATPHVAGVAAIIAARNPGGGPVAWRAKLTSSADDLGPKGRDPQFGFGRVNLRRAVSP